ncbi:DUF1796 family putative cysteine peptidase [Paenibacillus mucilaginosus]|uniref:Peptidase n=3 Tax=Paenibacillus mucilaginosus TaxID=61624 RepID=H6NR98_9BACL|nr:DUF1796 family putative cysteine peptidase [Paenibacillus mucilaginosus]AFC32791.1 hypothetical protein PM3016_6148 [Paenibacillus mucilaginosus 3016]AFH65127.1 hypothetical protein B2K_31215 [Paenibacillus mucilaginosus K02]MCG7213036.1 papain-like cysteine peptidase [Paenibacillus mucilaginosus]WDM26558.1 hypothetical protein KCX80_29690 [Paenibacillus mucilaginosus]WFA21254.1 hypothetical protein ERY13_30445 [Paenibacillus mucilaginosus]
MRLAELRRPYDYCISLGNNCMPAMELEKKGLKRETLPLDWVISRSTTRVAELLLYRFPNYMQLPNLVIRCPDPKLGTYVVEDLVNGIESYHDFALFLNTSSSLPEYPVFRVRLERRIERLYRILQEKRDLLFIRTGEVTPEEGRLLKGVIEQITGPGKTAHLLIINNHPRLALPRELDWGIPGVCTVEIPYSQTQAERNRAFFGGLLEGISVR